MKPLPLLYILSFDRGADALHSVVERAEKAFIAAQHADGYWCKPVYDPLNQL